MGNRVEIGLKVRIHYKRVTLTKQGIHVTQSILATTTRTKAIARFCKVLLENRFQNIAQRGLYHSIANRGNTQRSFLLRARFGNPNPLNDLWSVRPGPKHLGQATKMVLESGIEHLNGHAINPGAAPIDLDFGKSSSEVIRGADLVHQAVPLTSSHPVFQGRQHTIRPDARFNPAPSVSDLSDRFSPARRAGHWSRLFFRLSVGHVSTSLPPFAPRPLRRFIATMEALTPARHFPTYRSPCFTYSPFLTIPSPTTWCSPVVALYTLLCSQLDRSPISRPFAFSVDSGHRQNGSRLRHSLAGSPEPPGRNGFVILRTGRSPPVALHPASRRRSYSRLQAVA